MTQLLSYIFLFAATLACVESARPCESCPDTYQPVCGSDGVTYGNICEARCRGVTREHNGECGCICTADYAPVCGEDGVTYSNSCRAACADVAVAYGGTCEGTTA